VALAKAVWRSCHLTADTRSRSSEGGEIRKAQSSGPDWSENCKARTRNGTAWSRPPELSLKSELMELGAFCFVLGFRSRCQAGTRFPSYGASKEKEIFVP